MEHILRNSNNNHYLTNKYQIETAADIGNLPTTEISPGSEAYATAEGTTYILDNNYEWKLKKSK